MVRPRPDLGSRCAGFGQSGGAGLSQPMGGAVGRTPSFRSYGANPLRQRLDAACLPCPSPAGSKARLVLMLALNTGMSPTDICRVGWQHVGQKDGRARIAYKRIKTSVAADLPTLPELAEELANLPKDRMLFVTQDAKPIGYKPETSATGSTTVALKHRCPAYCMSCARQGRRGWLMPGRRTEKSRLTWPIRTPGRLTHIRRRRAEPSWQTAGSPSWEMCPTSLPCWTERQEIAMNSNILQEEVAARRGVEPLFSG